MLSELKEQLKMMYIIWAVLTITGSLLIIMLQPFWLWGFLFGAAVAAVCFFISYLSFVGIHVKNKQGVGSGLQSSLPKLALLTIGAVICSKAPDTLSVLAYLIGFCLYVVTYWVAAGCNYIQVKNQ